MEGQGWIFRDLGAHCSTYQRRGRLDAGTETTTTRWRGYFWRVQGPGIAAGLGRNWIEDKSVNKYGLYSVEAR
jgi:hypothetical protein